MRGSFALHGAWLFCVVVLALAPGCSARRAERHGPWITSESGGKQGPNRTFLNQRRIGDGKIPLRARGRALEAARAAGLVDAPGSWINVGPLNIGGRVTALAIDPNLPDHLWLGTADGGVFTSFDGGDSWSPVFDGQTSLSIGSLAVHPTDSTVLYAGTGEDNGGGFSYDGEGLFKTTDGGATWADLGLAEVRRIGNIVVGPLAPDRVLVAAGGDWFNKDTHRGVYRSTDGGASWQQVLFVADDAGAIDLEVHPAQPDRIFASIWQRHSAGSNWYIGGPLSGIWRSLDGGATWSRLTTGLPATAGRIGLAIAPTNPQTLYACVIDGQGRLDGVYRSIDAGETWGRVSVAATINQFSSYSYYFSQIRVDPDDENVVYALDVRLWRSIDRGKNYSQVAASVHVDWHDLIIESGGRWLAGTDGGFYRSLDDGASWFKPPLPITQFYDLGIDRLDPQRRFAGAQDNNTVRTTTGGLSDWTPVIGGDGMQCEVDYTDSNKVYGEAQYGAIRRSVDGGDSFVTATSGIDGADRRNWNTPITLDPQVPSTLYTGTYRVYRSIDSAVSWTPISADLTDGHPGGHAAEEDRGEAHLQNLVDGTITVVAVSPVDNDLLWVGTDDGNVWVSEDAGLSFVQVDPPGPGYWVTDIEPDRFDAATAYLTVTGYRSGDRLPYVRVTRDLGASWADLSGGGLPQVPVNSVLPSTEWRGRLFAGTDVGVFLSDDDGASWAHVSGGMPRVVVLDLVEHAPTQTIYAGTHGRSIYTYDLGQLPPADGDGDGVDNNADCALADAGAFAAPGEVALLLVGKDAVGAALLGWSDLGGQAGAGTVYDVAAGELASLAQSATGASSSLACAVPTTSLADPAELDGGTGRYYLVRGRNGCGIGGWGEDGMGADRVSPACP